jgi:type II secretory pathway component PulF
MTLIKDIKKIKTFIHDSDLLISKMRRGDIASTQALDIFKNLPSTLPILSPSLSKQLNHEQLLTLLKTFFEEKLSRLKTIGTILLYPILVFSLLLFVGLSYLLFVIPIMVSFLSDLGDLPPLLSHLLTLSQFISSKWDVVFLGLCFSLSILFNISFISSRLLSLFFTSHRHDLYFLIGILLQQGLPLNERFSSFSPKKNDTFYKDIKAIEKNLYKTGSFYISVSNCFSLNKEETFHLSKGDLLGTLDTELITLSKRLGSLSLQTHKLTAKKLQFCFLCILSFFITLMIYITFIPLTKSLSISL